MAFGIEIAKATSLGTSTVKTLLNGGANIKLPERARSIVAIRPYLAVDTPTAGQTVWAKVTLESDDFKITPYEVLGGVAGSTLAKAGICLATLPEIWPVNCPVSGGSELKVYGTALVANTAAPYLGVEIVISDLPPRAPQVHAKMGTLTDTGTSAGEVAGTAYTFTGGRKLIEVYGLAAKTTVAATEALAGYFRFESSEFEPPFPVKVAAEPIHGAVSTDATTASNTAFVLKIRRGKVDLRIAPNSTTVQDYFDVELAPATTGKFVTGVLYI